MRKFEIISQEQQNKDLGDKEHIVKLPHRATKCSAGYDFYLPYDIELKPGEEIKVPTGIKAAMNEGEVLMIYPRSSLGFKYYCRLANTVGVVDADYYNNVGNEGHIFVKFRNESDKTLTLKCGEAFCQGIFMQYLVTDDDGNEEHDTRVSGLGSTNR